MGFKVGDKVRALYTCHGQFTAGKEYVVSGINNYSISIAEDDAGSKENGWSPSNFELVTPALRLEPGKHYRTRNGKATGRVSKGDAGFEVVFDGRVRVYDAAGGHVYGDSDLDIVEPWVPKVGERVRYSGKSTIYNEQELVGLEGTVTDGGVELVNVKWDRPVVHGITTGGAKYIANVEPLPVAAASQGYPTFGVGTSVEQTCSQIALQG